MRHNKTWNGLLAVVGVLTVVVLSGCAKETLEVTESGFSCSGKINAGVWECTGSARMKQDDLEQTFVVTENEPVHEISDTSVATKPSVASQEARSLATAAPAAESISYEPSCRPLYSPEYFYLQFSAARTEDGLKVLAARLSPVKTNIVSITIKGESWFVLISTRFRSRQAAQSVAALWQAQGMSKPWIRPGYSLLAVLDSQYSVESSASGCR